MKDEEFNELWDTCEWRDEIDKLRVQVAELKSRNAVALEMMKEIEWCDTEYDPAHGHSAACPTCGGANPKLDIRFINQHVGHNEDCELNEAIELLETKL